MSEFSGLLPKVEKKPGPSRPGKWDSGLWLNEIGDTGVCFVFIVFLQKISKKTCFGNQK